MILVSTEIGGAVHRHAYLLKEGSFILDAGFNDRICDMKFLRIDANSKAPGNLRVTQTMLR